MDEIIAPTQTINEPQKTSKLAIASLVLGILSIPLFFLKLGIIAVILGIISLFKLKNPLLKGKVLAIIGISLGIIGIILALLPVTFWGGLYGDVMFNPNTLSPQKIEATQKVLDQDVILIEQYKTQNGAYPQSLDYVNGIITAGFYEIYYELSADKNSYILRSEGPDRLCGTGDDILPTSSTQTKKMDCLVDLGSNVTVPTSVLSDTKNDFAKTSVYYSMSDWNPANTYRPNYTIEYPSLWRKRSIESPVAGINATKSIKFSKIDLKYSECTSCFGGAEMTVAVYFKNPAPKYPYTMETIFEDSTSSAKDLQFSGYNAKMIEGTNLGGGQYVGQKITFKKIAFETADEIFLLYYSYDASLPMGADMDKLINSFKIIK